MSKRVIECKSWDGVTIGLIDSMLAISRVLVERLHAEQARLKAIQDGPWFSEDVQEALADLRHDDCIGELIYPGNTEAMRLIHEAAALIKTRSVTKS